MAPPSFVSATPPSDARLSESGYRTFAELSQRSPDDINRLKSLWYNATTMVERETSLFLPVPTSQYDPAPTTKTTILQDTGALLKIPESLARLVLYQVEGCIHKLSRDALSEEQWVKVQTLGKKLARQHPDHVTNVVTLWKKIIDLKGEDLKENTIKDLGLLWQHPRAEVVLIFEKLEMQISGIKVEDEQVIVAKIEVESG